MKHDEFNGKFKKMIEVLRYDENMKLLRVKCQASLAEADLNSNYLDSVR